MSPAQRELGSIMIEIGDLAYRDPTCIRMATFAWRRQRAVWIRSCSSLSDRNRGVAQKQKRSKQHFQTNSSHVRRVPRSIRDGAREACAGREGATYVAMTGARYCPVVRTTACPSGRHGKVRATVLEIARDRRYSKLRSSGRATELTETARELLNGYNVLRIVAAIALSCGSCRLLVWRRVAIRTFAGREAVNDYRMPFRRPSLRMASVAAHIRMAPRQGEGCLVVIESRRRPAFGVMAVFAKRDAVFCELAAVHIHVAILAIC